MTRTHPGGIVRPRRPIERGSLSTRLAALLENVAGRTVTLHVLQGDQGWVSPSSPDNGGPLGMVIARYQLQGEPDRYVLVDLPAIASLGGARAMLSHGVVQAALTDESWPEALVDNCLDVLINLAQLWDRTERPVRLVHTYGLVHHQDVLPPEVIAALTGPARRLDTAMSVAGYDSGRVSLIKPQPNRS